MGELVIYWIPFPTLKMLKCFGMFPTLLHSVCTGVTITIVIDDPLFSMLFIPVSADTYLSGKFSDRCICTVGSMIECMGLATIYFMRNIQASVIISGILMGK